MTLAVDTVGFMHSKSTYFADVIIGAYTGKHTNLKHYTASLGSVRFTLCFFAPLLTDFCWLINDFKL